jgi:hypothetical protein
VLLVRRGPGEWWEGLWDFPRVSRARRGDRELGVVTYTVTRHRVTCTVIERSATPRDRAGAAAGRWVTVAGLARLPLAAPARRIAALIAAAASSRRPSTWYPLPRKATARRTDARR